MTDTRQKLQHQAALEYLHQQRQNLIQTISGLVAVMKALPEGEARGRLLDEISCLDVIAENIGKGLEIISSAR